MSRRPGYGDRVAAWLLKTEPGDYSFDDLVRDGKTHWDGVTNTTAQMHMRSMQVGDTVVVYHSQSEREVVAAAATTDTARAGLEEATRAAADRLWRFLDGAYAGASC